MYPPPPPEYGRGSTDQLFAGHALPLVLGDYCYYYY